MLVLLEVFLYCSSVHFPTVALVHLLILSPAFAMVYTRSSNNNCSGRFGTLIGLFVNRMSTLHHVELERSREVPSNRIAA